MMFEDLWLLVPNVWIASISWSSTESLAYHLHEIPPHGGNLVAKICSSPY